MDYFKHLIGILANNSIEIPYDINQVDHLLHNVIKYTAVKSD